MRQYSCRTTGISPQIIAEAIAAALCLTVIFVILHLMPGASGAAVCAGTIFCAGGYWVYRHSAAYTTAGGITLMIAIAAMIAGVIANVNYFTAEAGFSDANPYLQNTDANRVWNNALAFYNGSWRNDTTVWNLYGAVISLTFIPAGPSITAALMISVACGTATLILTALTAKRLTGDNRISTVSMIAVACVCYLMASATILVKDIWVVMCFATAAYGLCEWRRSSFLWVLAAIAMLCLTRKNMVLAIALGVAITAIPYPAGQRKAQLMKRSLLIIIGIALILIAQSATISPTITGQLAGSEDYVMNRNDARLAFFDIVGAETNTDPLRKILFFPLLALTQFLIPLPWDFARDTIFGPTLAYAHFGYPWYLFGAIFLYYLAAAKRKAGNRMLLAVTLWGAITWFIPVYVAMGTVSRYALCAVPLMAPAVGAVLVRCHRRRSLWIWLVAYAVIIAAGLLFVYNLQHRFM